MSSSKKCTKCGTLKKINEFNKGRKSDIFGVRSRCKKCTQEDRRLYCKNNKEKRKIYQTKYQPTASQRMRERYQTEQEFRLARIFRSRVRDALRVAGCCKKYSSRQGSSLLGCSFSEYKKYLESKFQEGMTWDKVVSGDIHIDHIIPCSAFDLSKAEAQKRCFHYTNTQPMWAKENLKKSKTLDISFIKNIPDISPYLKNIIQQNVQT
jgi:hypothetical protein